jgi:uncharacterized protein YraI
MKRAVWLTTLALLLGAPALALADQGYVTGNVNLRAGPDLDYPRIDTIPAGAPVDIQGCTDGFEWCDVIVGNDRGWVAGNYIQYSYQNQQVLVPDYGARIGIPIVVFSIATYWDRYYVRRPFYRERDRWYQRPPSHHRPPPPPYRPRPNPGHGNGHGPGPSPGRPPGHGGGRPPENNRPPVNRPSPNQPRPMPRPMPRPTAGPVHAIPNAARPSQGNRPPPQMQRPAQARPTPPQHQQQGQGKPQPQRGNKGGKDNKDDRGGR